MPSSAFWLTLLQAASTRAGLQQVREMLRADFAAITLGIVITGIGLAALVVAAFYWKSRGALLSFAILAALYGIRLLALTHGIRFLFNWPALAWTYLISVITDLITIPVAFFFYDIAAEPWKRSIRWLVWFVAAYGATAVAIDAASRSPFRTPDPVYFLFIGVAVGLLEGRFRRRLTFRVFAFDWPEARALAFGSIVFLLFVLNEHLVRAGVVPWQARAEPLGFLTFVCSLGYIAARRFFANQQQLLGIAQEMSAARQIQFSILPQQPPRVKGLRLAVRYAPMASVAGDFYDFHQVDGKQLGVLVADSVGHGVPAALIASMIKAAFAAQASRASRPAELLTELNRVFCDLARGQLITAAYLFLDLEQLTALYAGAGHPPLLCFRRATSTVEEWEKNGLLLGFQPAATYSNLPLELRPGDRILLYTDGITEASNPAGELFGAERFKQFLATHAHLPPDTFADALLAELSKWSGGGRLTRRPQEDDLTLIVIDVEGDNVHP